MILITVVVAFLVTVTTWIPIALFGFVALKWGWFDGLTFAVAAALTNLGALRLFDAALSRAEDAGDRLADAPDWLHGGRPMFALGAGVTLVTLSVVVSLTLVVPLALRGTIRRNAIIP